MQFTNSPRVLSYQGGYNPGHPSQQMLNKLTQAGAEREAMQEHDAGRGGGRRCHVVKPRVCG